MAIIDQHRLNEQVVLAASFLAQSLPHHLTAMRLKQHGDYYDIVLEHPHELSRPIEITTKGREITLSFGECHSHLDSVICETNEAGMVEEMVIAVVLLVSGAQVSYSAWEGDHCLGGGWFRRGTDGREGLDHFPQADRLRVVGWESGADAELRRHVPPAC
jgi:hypothetical protein